MYRSAMKQLITWKSKENRKPLLIMGARQTGKLMVDVRIWKNKFRKSSLYFLLQQQTYG